MISLAVQRRVGDASTPEENVEARFALCNYKVNDAFFLGKMDYRETRELRDWLNTVREMIVSRMWRRAADILGDVEYILDETLHREPEDAYTGGGVLAGV